MRVDHEKAYDSSKIYGFKSASQKQLLEYKATSSNPRAFFYPIVIVYALL